MLHVTASSFLCACVWNRCPVVRSVALNDELCNSFGESSLSLSLSSVTSRRARSTGEKTPTS